MWLYFLHFVYYLLGSHSYTLEGKGLHPFLSFASGEQPFWDYLLKRLSFPHRKATAPLLKINWALKFICRLSVLTHQSTGPSLHQCHTSWLLKSSDMVALSQNSLGYPGTLIFRITWLISTKHLIWKVVSYYFLE